jgi:hypothetical protein
MSDDELQRLLAEWQKTLRLQDWRVTARFKRIFDLTRNDIKGEVNWTLPIKEAVINLLEPADYAPAFVGGYDPERTLVHELLHLHFAPFAPIGEETYQHEQAIDAISKALIDAKHSR